jgi:FkbM family methyltransferase
VERKAGFRNTSNRHHELNSSLSLLSQTTESVTMASHDIQDSLIFDLGLHKGFDAEFYLKKGFRVVGLEAVPELARASAERLSPFGDQFTLVNKALYDVPDSQVSFYTVPDKDDWGSLDINVAQKGTQSTVEITVQTTDLTTLFDTHGVPHYIKCDMEGGDIIFRQQLLVETRRPRFVSLEMNDGREGEIMAACGYDVAQIVNQWMHAFKSPPQPAREGRYVQATFNGETSGLFGRELPPHKWRPIGEVDAIYRRWKELRFIDDELAPGWVDLHVARKADLE